MTMIIAIIAVITLTAGSVTAAKEIKNVLTDPATQSEQQGSLSAVGQVDSSAQYNLCE